MSSISDHHQYLFLGKVTNTLTAEEDRELQELFARDHRAQSAYDELLRQLPAGQVEGSFSHLNQPGFWKNLPGEIRDQQGLVRKGKVLRAGIMLALAGVFAAGGWWFLARQPINRQEPSVVQAPSIVQAPRSVELRLADGSKVDLTATSGRLQKGQLVLDNSNSSLSYRALGPSPQTPGPASQPPGPSSQAPGPSPKAPGVSSQSPEASTTTGLNTLDVPVAMDYKVILSDGSEIWLNSVSSLSFPSTFAADKREITIKGEAYCKIAKHPNQPFIIHLPGNTIQVTGTEFNVNTYSPTSVRVALVDGGINLLAGTNTLKLNPGFQAVSTAGKIEQAPFQADKVLGWREGIFTFDGAELEDISQVLARWFGIKTQLDDATLAHKKFAGALYKKRPLSSFLDNFKVISHIDSYFDEKGVLHFVTAAGSRVSP
ncbi:MAG TPA: FecR domain-containing protein [Puia sp.]|nr:FecR domain-containing protein [Puia sp.]